MPSLSVISLIAYDYRFVYSSIRSYYDIVDEIIIGLDDQRLSWSRKPFNINLKEVEDFVSQVDIHRKIKIIEHNFHQDENPMKNDTYERNYLSSCAIEGNWIVQIDADEIMINKDEFKAWMNVNNPIDFKVLATLQTVYKTFGSKSLVVDPPTETVPVATMLRSAYTTCRYTSQNSI